MLFTAEVVDIRTTCPKCGRYLIPVGSDDIYGVCSRNVKGQCSYGRLVPIPGWHACVTEFLKQKAPKVRYDRKLRQWLLGAKVVQVGGGCRESVKTFEPLKGVAWRGGEKGGEMRLVRIINAGHELPGTETEGASDGLSVES